MLTTFASGYGGQPRPNFTGPIPGASKRWSGWAEAPMFVSVRGIQRAGRLMALLCRELVGFPPCNIHLIRARTHGQVFCLKNAVSQNEATACCDTMHRSTAQSHQRQMRRRPIASRRLYTAETSR